MVISLVATPSDLLNAPLSNLLLLLLLLAKGFFPSARKERKRPLFSPKGRSKGGTVFSLVSPQHFSSSSSAPSNLFPGGENVRLRSSFFPPSCIFPPPPRASLPLQGMQKKGDTKFSPFLLFSFSSLFLDTVHRCRIEARLPIFGAQYNKKSYSCLPPLLPPCCSCEGRE